MDYFNDWNSQYNINARNDKEQWLHLQHLFKKADNQFSDRFGQPDEPDPLSDKNNSSSNSSDKKPADRIFLNILEDLEQNWNSYQKSEDLRKLAHLVKGNILLRRGQVLGEYFFNPLGCYQQALILLEQSFEPEKRDFLNLMVQLNLGKYFRNIGKYGQRSDYRRAKDEFKSVKAKLCARETGKETFALWETHLWLEASVNIGRAERYLYQLKKAKITFWTIVKILTSVYEDPDHAWEYQLKKHKHVLAQMESVHFDPGTIPELTVDSGLYTEYMTQALVQLGIAYQKSRDYELAQELSKVVLNIDSANIDAANNLGVCLRKIAMQADADIRIPEKFTTSENGLCFLDMSYGEIFVKLKEGHNRFATLHTLKCSLHEPLLDGRKIEEEFKKLLKNNPYDQEVRLLQGLFYQRCGKWDESHEIFRGLYKQSPYILKGTIGLKAYYNMALNLICQEQFYEAKNYLEKILAEYTEPNTEPDAPSDTMPAQPDIWLEDLPEGDLLSEIDLGWCLLNLGYYKEAQACYETILRKYERMLSRLGRDNIKKIRNNLGECYLRTNNIEQAKEQFKLVLCLNEADAVANRYLAYCHMAGGKAQQSAGALTEARKYFEKSDAASPYNVHTYSGWLAAMISLLELKNWNDKELISNIENKLRYSTGVCSIKACANLARFIKEVDKRERACASFRNETLTADTDERIKMLYRSFARIRLGEREEGYSLFRHFLDTDIFRWLSAEDRGKILAVLFPVYETIMQIKELCRYVSGDDSEAAVSPVHYTKIHTLKKLLETTGAGTPKLRLWNTVYMNDSFEGECFIEMMKALRKGDDAAKQLRTYFPYLENSSKKDSMESINENIYVGSFSGQADQIHMWIPYADDAKGCSVIFGDDFFDVRKGGGTLTEVSDYSDNDYPLYRIQYVNTDLWKMKETAGSSETLPSGIGEILEHMKGIWRFLDEMDCCLSETDQKYIHKNIQWDKAAKTVRSFVADCLNEIRFLFKSDEYSYEDEVRMIRSSYTPKIEEQIFQIPRLYVEVERDIQIKEVKLGSKISPSDANEISSWLKKTGRVDVVSRSNKHYK